MGQFLQDQPPRSGACDGCLRRADLVARLGPHIETAHAMRLGRPRILALSDDRLIDELGGRHAGALRAGCDRFSTSQARAHAVAAGINTTCRHEHLHYPKALLELSDPPAALHWIGRPGALRELTSEVRRCAAVVGARKASEYGLEVARSLGRDLSEAGVTVVSGMALGVDGAAHEGAIEAGGRTVAVLGGGADVAYPPSKRRLHGRLAATGVVISEMPPGCRVWRWSFPARNRIIAGLAAVTIVVEAQRRSGSLITAQFATDLDRELGAVPGRVTSALARGPNDLLADGAVVVRDAGDVLDLLGIERPTLAPPPQLMPVQAAVLAAVLAGAETLSAITATVNDGDGVMLALVELELGGRVRRDLGGRYTSVGI
ncbi:MAG: DNA-processing protein DprA [Solirubrobacterales bacterium]|nr:DNA-processing protein DprA [Solirubrobacterales bacterium]